MDVPPQPDEVTAHTAAARIASRLPLSAEGGFVMERRERRVTCISIVALAAFPIALVMAGVYSYWVTPDPYAALADVTYRDGGKPYIVTAVLQDDNDVRIPGVQVHIQDPSGGSILETDENGIVEFRPDGGVTCILINGTKVVRERDIFTAPGPGYQGWIVTITVKDPAALGLQPPGQ
jgi:hypothetical protein